MNADLSLTGFDEIFIDEIMKANKENAKNDLIDIAPAVPDKPKSKTGEIYLLGDHRLMCGDSTKEEDVKKLMQDKISDLCWTDPPYGVSYQSNRKDERKVSNEVMANDELRDVGLSSFLLEISKNISKFTKPNAALYCCYASKNHIIFENALNSAGFEVKQQLIWAKGHVLGRSDYHWTHEPILYCKKKDGTTPWYGDRTHVTVVMNNTIEQLENLKKEELIKIISEIRENSDIINVQKDSVTSYMHPTQKPVGLIKSMIKNSSRPKDILFEPFGGSGSTLMACEETKRTCYCMEIDPKYTDVILTRWSQFTGKEPIRESDKKTWGEIKNGKR